MRDGSGFVVTMTSRLAGGSPARSSYFIKLILSRLLLALPLLLAVVVVTFVLIHLAPGDPLQVLLGEYPASPEFVADLRARYGLDRPLPEQLLNYLGNLAQGDLGYSLKNRTDVADLVLSRLPATALLMFSAMILAALIGVGLGTIAALRPYSLVDNLASAGAVIGYSAPVFWLGQILIIVLASEFGWFPIQGMQSLRPVAGRPVALDIAWHLVLPALALSFRYSSINARMTRSSMVETLEKDFIVTARAKGLSSSAIVLRHALHNALIPIVTVIGYNFGYVLTGSVIVETVFGWPGIGRLLFESLAARDMPVVIAVFLLGAVMAVIANLLTDIAYAVVDPRIGRD